MNDYRQFINDWCCDCEHITPHLNRRCRDCELDRVKEEDGVKLFSAPTHFEERDKR